MKLSCDQLRRRFLQAGPLAVWSLLSHGAPSPVAAQARSTNERQLRPVDEKAGGAAAPPRAQFWLLAIGVDTTDKGQVEKLKYCAADAHLMAKTVRDFCAFDRVLVLASDESDKTSHPTRGKIDSVLDYLSQNAGLMDTVVVFFAGHGYLNSDGEGFLVTQDFDLAHPNNTGVPINALRDKLNGCKAQQKLLLLDCCHSGSVDIIFSSDKVTKGLKEANGTITITSCGADEKSYELEKTGHGLFTSNLAEGLAGAADRDGNQTISSGELYQFAHDRTTAAAEAKGWKQEPRQLIAPNVRGVFSIASVRPHPMIGQRWILLAEDLQGPGGRPRTTHGELLIENVGVNDQFSGTQWRWADKKDFPFDAAWRSEGKISLDTAKAQTGVQFRGELSPWTNRQANEKFALGDLLDEGGVVYYARENTRDVYLFKPAPGTVFLSSLVELGRVRRISKELRDKSYDWRLLQQGKVGFPPLAFFDQNNFDVSSATANGDMILKGLICVPQGRLNKNPTRPMGLEIRLDSMDKAAFLGPFPEWKWGAAPFDLHVPKGTRMINIHFADWNGKVLGVAGDAVWSAMRLVPVNKPPKS